MRKIILLSLIFPVITFAQVANDFSVAAKNVLDLVNQFTAIAFSLAFLAFFWGFAKYLSTKSEETKKQGVQIMATSVAIIFVMVSVWGIVRLVQKTVGIGESKEEKIKVPRAVPH